MKNTRGLTDDQTPHDDSGSASGTSLEFHPQEIEAEMFLTGAQNPIAPFSNAHRMAKTSPFEMVPPKPSCTGFLHHASP